MNHINICVTISFPRPTAATNKSVTMATHARDPITTHVLDTTLGLPAKAVRISLYKHSGDEGTDSWIWGSPIAETVTNSDGRGGFAIPRYAAVHSSLDDIRKMCI